MKAGLVGDRVQVISTAAREHGWRPIDGPFQGDPADAENSAPEFFSTLLHGVMARVVHSSRPSTPRVKPLPESRDLVRMGELARSSGVPSSTIKHYLREGLLPGKSVSIARNSALYDRSLIEQIRHIKALQTTHFLPLWRIKEVLSGKADAAVATVAAAVDRVLEVDGPVRSESVDALLHRGLRQEELDFLIDHGLVARSGMLGGDDLVLCETIIRAREAGLTDRLSTLTVLHRYHQQVETLVAAEIAVFQEGIVTGAGERLAASTVEAMKVSERLVLLLRRRMLLPVFERLALPTPTPPKAARSKPTTKPAATGSAKKPVAAKTKKTKSGKKRD